MANRSHQHRLASSIARILTSIIFAIGSLGVASAQTRIISLSGDLDFGSIPLGLSAQRTLIISNAGDSVLTISNLDFPPVPILEQVAFQASFSGTIEPGGSVYVPITFTPLGTTINGGSNELDFEGYLSVASDATAGTGAIWMTGIGTWPPLATSLNLDFGTLPLGQNKGIALSITNTGTTPVTVSNSTVADSFSFPFWTSATIAPGTATNLMVVFFPTAITNYQNTALFSSDAGSPVLVLVTANGNVTNSADGSIAFGVSGSGTYPSGNFNGLFMPTNNPAFENSGYFTAESTAKGKLRATLTLAGKRYPFSAQISPAATVSATIKRKKLPDLNVSLQFGAGFYSRDWTGTIDDGTWTAQLTAEPAPLLSKNSLRAIPSGKYTFIIAGNTNSSVVGPAAQGTGTLNLKISDATRLSGMLGDGTAFFQNTVLCNPNRLPFYASLYGGRGAIMGWIAFGLFGRGGPPPPPVLDPPIVGLRPPGVTNPPVAIPIDTNITDIPIIIYGPGTNIYGPGTNPPVVVLPPFPVTNITVIEWTNQPVPILPFTNAPIRILSERSTEPQFVILGTLHWFKPAGIDSDYPDGFSFQTTVSGSGP